MAQGSSTAQCSGGEPTAGGLKVGLKCQGTCVVQQGGKCLHAQEAWGLHWCKVHSSDLVHKATCRVGLAIS